ncbi:MAG: hypothetical protein ACREK4_19355 [Candidatus Rokuibacteriota bacterium]
MKRAMSAGFVLLVLVAAISGCADHHMTAPVATAQQECERAGGVWRSGSCERSSGGGGGGY